MNNKIKSKEMPYRTKEQHLSLYPEFEKPLEGFDAEASVKHWQDKYGVADEYALQHFKEIAENEKRYQEAIKNS